MRIALAAVLSAGLAMGMFGCHQDRPHEVGEQRPDVDALHEDDRGLQSKDVVAASNQMARDLLASDPVRTSPTQVTIVADKFANETRDRNWDVNYDIFIARLQTNLGLYGKGQVTLIQNKQTTNVLRNAERDDMPTGTPRVQPNFSLHGKAMDMPNRATNYYFLQFELTDLRSGVIVWTNKYEVKVAR
jgi:hypothetical protein